MCSLVARQQLREGELRSFEYFKQSFAFFSGIILSRLVFGFLVAFVYYLILTHYMGIR